MENTDEQLLDNLYLLYNIERENFDGSLAEHQILQYSPHQNFVLYGNPVR